MSAKASDRLILLGMVVVGVLGAFWLRSLLDTYSNESSACKGCQGAAIIFFSPYILIGGAMVLAGLVGLVGLITSPFSRDERDTTG
ncbi:MAG TPA: hypothetical protein PL051_04185 [Candidatus Saccharibacteria bacterium]|nr:hypothetical protein [Candidatus Saccharibacteria bacterium]